MANNKKPARKSKKAAATKTKLKDLPAKKTTNEEVTEKDASKVTGGGLAGYSWKRR